MRRSVIASLACGGALVAAVAAVAQDRAPGGPGGPFGGRGGPRAAMSAGDRQAFADARIAALKAGLQLSPEQEKLWPPVEEAMRGLAKQRTEARTAMRERWASMRDGEMSDMPGQLRFMADRQAASADALRKLADASAPLYASLDEAQKRRLRVLARFVGPERGGRGAGRHEGGGRGWMRRGGLDGGMPRFADRGGFDEPHPTR